MTKSKLRILTTACLLCTLTTTSALANRQEISIEEAELAWKNRFGANGFDMYSGTATLSDGNVVAVGRSGAFNSGDWAGIPGYGANDAIAVKYDEAGTIVWKKNFGGTSSDQFDGITALPDGGFIAVGYAAQNSIGNNDFTGLSPKGAQDAIIGRFDNEGNVMWFKNFGGSADDYLNGVTVVSDGIIAVGYSAFGSFGNGDFVGLTAKGWNDAVIVKFDFNGNIMWVKNHGGSDDRFTSVTTVSDGVVAVGYSSTASFGQGDWVGLSGRGGFDGTIVKFNNAGNVVWRRVLGSSGHDYFNDIVSVPDGIVIMSYVAAMNNDFAQLMGKGGPSDAVIIKLNNAANVIMWMKNFGGAHSDSFSAITADDNGFIAVGYSGEGSFGNGDWQNETARGGEDIVVARFDASGNLKWNKHFGGSGNDYATGVAIVSSGVLVAGYSVEGSFNNGDWEGIEGRGGTDAVMIKYDLTTAIFTPRTISGTVTDGTNPIGNAKIVIEGTNRVVYTNQNGVYLFETLQPGEYELTASKYGYYDKTEQVDVQDDDAQQNFELAALPTFPVSGKIIGNSSPEGIENVEVKIFNDHENLVAYTDADGNYIFPAILGSEEGIIHNITATLTGFYIYNSTVTVYDNHDPVTGIVYDITLTERLIMPGQAVAVEIDDNNVEITWEVPGTDIFRHDSGVNNGQLGFNGGSRYSIIGSVHRVNAELNNMQWYSTTESVQPAYDLWIFGLNAAGIPDRNNVIYMVQNVQNTPSQWNTYQFPEPILVPDGFFMGVSPSNGGFTSIGVDRPNAEYPFMANENFYSSDYSMYDFSNFTESNISQNCMIRAEGYINGKAVSMGYRALTNYRIYRLLEIHQNDETLWHEVSTNVTGLTFTDTGWDNAEWGMYKWAIKAEYSGNALSLPRFTNVLPKDMEVPFTVNLTTNSQEPVIDAVITLNNLDDTAKSQTKTAEGPATLFANVWRGNYEIIVTLDGFDIYSENIQILAAGEHTANLIENLKKPFGLNVEVENCNALFMWNVRDRITYILDDGTAENGARISANQTISYGNLYITENEGVIKSVDVYGYLSGGLTRTVTLDIYNEARVLIGSSDPFVLPANAWITVPMDDIPFSGTFYAMVHWHAAEGLTYFLGYDQTGPNVNGNHNYLKTGDTWELVHIAFSGQIAPGVFMIRPTAEIIEEDKSRAFAGYTVYLNGEEIISGLQAEEYLFSDLTTGFYIAGVQSAYTTGASDIVTQIFNIIGCDINIKENVLSSVVLYPNPFTDEINISSEHPITNIQITNATGQKVKEIVLTNETKTIETIKTIETSNLKLQTSNLKLQTSNLKLETSTLPCGVYFVIIESHKGEKFVHKIVKK